ncbi:MAG: lysine exporter LysO family protein [Flexistipes sinusarabici]|uniref:Lysine exporter LysO family protein n=1 Tax=Flexistipes sinusarabici TaxID=2352 RepID=A0A5D0MLC6_FLESI|nr:LysO family transporter [Flexistipes sinusarabici]TYB33816.1 MAG: lysine exporter LysO family protein [Flexistipes sinusarabici]
MLIFLFFLITGIAFGYFLSGKYINKTQKFFLNISILLLLFFMGVSIGKDPELFDKIAGFGFQAFVIASSTIFFSIIGVLIVINFMENKQ